MLCKLAWGNVRRAGKDYLVYLLTLTLAVSVFYAFNTISIQVDFVSMEEALSRATGGIFSGLTLFLAAVMGFLMVYANGFIMKRRKKEFGLYQVLGMSRGQVARVAWPSRRPSFPAQRARAGHFVRRRGLPAHDVLHGVNLQDANRELPFLLLHAGVHAHSGVPARHLPGDACLQPTRGGSDEHHRPHERRP
ncbi:MAG: ABC transporter permease [Collinsella sp.]